MSGANGYGDVLTTGQVARVCRVAPRTVCKWYDAGKLQGYRIPMSEDRRIPRENLIRFLREHGMPVPAGLDLGRVLLIGLGSSMTDQMQELLPKVDGFRVESVGHVFDAGLLVHEFMPEAVVIDMGLGRSDAIQVSKRVRADEAAHAPPPSPSGREIKLSRQPRPVGALLVALAGEDETDSAGLRAAGFDAVLIAPHDMATVANLIRSRREG